MTDQQPTPAEIVGSQRPELSQEMIDQYREVLNRPGFAEQDPQNYARIKASVDRALQITGQRLEPEPDPRTPQQQHFDKRFALDPDSVLVEICLRDSKGPAPSPGEMNKAFERVGKSYADALRQGQHAVDHCPSLAGVKVENLPAPVLASLAAFWLHRDRFIDQRP